MLLNLFSAIALCIAFIGLHKSGPMSFFMATLFLVLAVMNASMADDLVRGWLE